MQTRDIVKIVTARPPLGRIPHTHPARFLFNAAVRDVAVGFSIDKFWAEAGKSSDWPTLIDTVVGRIQMVGPENLGTLANRIRPDSLPDPALEAIVTGFTASQMAAASYRHPEPFRAKPATLKALKAAGIWDIARDGDKVSHMLAVLIGRWAWEAFWDFKLPIGDIELAAQVYDFLRENGKRWDAAPPLTGAQPGLFDTTPAAAPSSAQPVGACRIGGRLRQAFASEAVARAELRRLVQLDGVGRWGKHHARPCGQCGRWHLLTRYDTARDDPVSSDNAGT